MKIKVLFLVPIISMLLLAGIVGQLFLALKTNSIQSNLITLVSDIIEENTIDGQIQSYIDYKAKAFSNEVNKTAMRALEIASVFSKNEKVEHAYAIAHSGNIDDPGSPQSQEARNYLRKELATTLEQYQAITGSSAPLNLHYHLPNGRSLVRLWRDGYQVNRNGEKLDISDDISSFRKTVMDINRGSKLALQGIEVGRGGFAIRGLCKIKDESGKGVGSNEVLLSFDSVTEVLASGDGEAFEVYMVDSLLDVATKLKNSEENPVRGRFVRVKTSDKLLGAKLFSPTLANRALNGVVYEKQKDYYVGMFPVEDYSGKAIGVVSMYVELDEQQALIASIRNDMAQSMGSIKWINLIVNGISMLFVALMIWLISEHITKKTKDLTGAMEIVTGGDLTHTVQSKGVEEYAEISGAVNEFLSKLKGSFRLIFAEVSSLIAYAHELNSSSQLASDGAKIMDQSAHSMSAATGHIQENAGEISTSIDSLTEDMNSISSAIEELNASFQEISNNCVKEREITEEASSLIQESNQVMNRLDQRAVEIGSVIDIIRNIADQTNLLALNATIEAASAGEAGKGFAVVANEVKELAKQCADAAGKIGEQIQEVQQNTKVASNSISKVTDVIDSVTQYATAIASSVEEQTTVTDMISRNVISATDSTLMLKQSVDETVGSIDEISSTVQDLLRQSMTVSSVSNSNLSTAAELSQISEELRDSVSSYNSGGCKFDITLVKMNHVKWNQRLNDAIAGKTHMENEEVASSSQCDFGKWIAGLDDPSLKAEELFKKMVELHDEVHVKARQVIECVNAHETAVANGKFREFQEVRTRMFHVLNEIYVIIGGRR